MSAAANNATLRWRVWSLSSRDPDRWVVAAEATTKRAANGAAEHKRAAAQQLRLPAGLSVYVVLPADQEPGPEHLPEAR